MTKTNTDLFRDGALTVPAACEFSGLSRTAIYSAMRSGELPFLQRGGRRLIPRRALAEMLAAGMQPSEERSDDAA